MRQMQTHQTPWRWGPMTTLPTRCLQTLSGQSHPGKTEQHMLLCPSELGLISLELVLQMPHSFGKIVTEDQSFE